MTQDFCLLTLLLRILHISVFEAEGFAASNLSPQRDFPYRPKSLLTERRCVSITVLTDTRGRGKPWGSFKGLSHIKLMILSQSQGRGTGEEI